MRYPLVLAKKCPQCGRRPWTHFVLGFGHYVYCISDCFTTDYYDDIRHAMIEWNEYVYSKGN